MVFKSLKSCFDRGLAQSIKIFVFQLFNYLKLRLQNIPEARIFKLTRQESLLYENMLYGCNIEKSLRIFLCCTFIKCFYFFECKKMMPILKYLDGSRSGPGKKGGLARYAQWGSRIYLSSSQHKFLAISVTNFHEVPCILSLVISCKHCHFLLLMFTSFSSCTLYYCQHQ